MSRSSPALAHFERFASAQDWAAFAHEWMDASARPEPAEWSKLRHALRHFGPQSPEEAASPQGRGWSPVMNAFAATPKWVAQGVEAGGFWCQLPSDNNLGWGVAAIEMRATGGIPEDNQPARERLAVWLANRRADAEELAVAAGWGLPRSDWESRMVLSIVWGDPSRRPSWLDDTAWRERSARSVREFVARGLFDASDCASSLAAALMEPVELRSADERAITLLALLGVDSEVSRKQLADEGRGSVWLASAAQALALAKAQGAHRPFLEQAHSRVEAMELAAGLAGAAPAAPSPAADPAARRPRSL